MGADAADVHLGPLVACDAAGADASEEPAPEEGIRQALTTEPPAVAGGAGGAEVPTLLLLHQTLDALAATEPTAVSSGATGGPQLTAGHSAGQVGAEATALCPMSDQSPPRLVLGRKQAMNKVVFQEAFGGEWKCICAVDVNACGSHALALRDPRQW